jgi:capsular exopolysaccharide synthesis family protein
VDLRTTLRVLREQWKLILVVALLTTLTGGGATWRQKPVYAAKVTLYVSAWGDVDNATLALQGSLLSQQRVKSYTELLRGERVMAAVVEQLHLNMTPSQLAAKITTTAIKDTALFTASVQDGSATRAQQIANAVAEQFLTLVPTWEGSPDEKKPSVRVTVVSPAVLPSSPVSPQPTRNLVLALLFGLLAGVGLAMARHTLDTRVKSIEQIGAITGVPSLGTVASDASAEKSPLITTDGPYAHRAEAFRKIRTNLQFVDVDRAHKVVLVTSAVAGEGKSVTTCNLAISLARAGKWVLLIDADLRRPRAAKYLGLPTGVGLTSVLVGEADLDDAIQSWGDDNLSVLASGPIPPNPSELLGSQHMRDLLDALRDRYDVVLIDAPPVLPVTDAVATATACDGAVLVVRHGKIKLDQLASAVQGLRSADVPVLGTVLNGAPLRGKQSYYYYQEYAPHPKDLSRHPVIGPNEVATDRWRQETGARL